MNSIFPVLVGVAKERRLIGVSWASDARVISELTEWKAPSRSDPLQCDAVEFAFMAAAKWRLSLRFGAVASSHGEMLALSADNSKQEVTGMLIARAAWFNAPLGFCLFHRTWTNNIFIDFLATNPETRALGSVNGTGLWLLLHICELAQSLGAKIVWAEATEGSAPYYKKCFNLPECGDLLLVEAERQQAFCKWVRSRFGHGTGAVSAGET